MASYDESHGTVEAPSFIPGVSCVVQEFILDMDELAQRNIVVADGDDIEFQVIPKGGYVLAYHWEVSRAATDAGAVTFTLEDAGVLVAATDAKTVDYGVFATPKYYKDGAKLKTTIAGDPAGLRLKFQFAVAPFSVDANTAVVIS